MMLVTDPVTPRSKSHFGFVDNQNLLLIVKRTVFIVYVDYIHYPTMVTGLDTKICSIIRNIFIRNHIVF